MYIVSFATWPDPACHATYLEHAQQMRAAVANSGGLIPVERACGKRR